MNLRAMLAGDLFLLVGPPMPERSKVRDQTKSSLPVLRVMRLGCGLITHSRKKIQDYANGKRGVRRTTLASKPGKVVSGV